mgnify:CR=1 FL=1
MGEAAKSSDPRMVSYYAARAPEYDRIYQKPERQADIADLRERLPALFAEAPLTAVFYGIYGAGDLLFAIFFALIGIRAWRNN